MNNLFKIFTLLLCISVSSFTFAAGPGSITKANIVMEALIKKDFKMTSALFKEEPALLYTPNADGITPLSLAVKNDDMSLFKYLIQAGAPVTSPYYDKPLLILALYSSSKQTIVGLLEKGADPQISYMGLSPLHIAVLLDRINFLDILLQYGADPDQLDNKGLTAFHLAVLKKQWDFIEPLAMVTHNLNTLDPNQLTPLLYFIKEESISNLEKFLDLTSEVNSKMLNFQTKKVESSLFLAIKEDNTDALTLLLKKGANVNLQDLNQKQTPLMLATQEDNEKAVKILLEYDPKLNLKNKKGKRAIDIAEPASNIMILLAEME